MTSATIPRVPAGAMTILVLAMVCQLLNVTSSYWQPQINLLHVLRDSLSV
jgi:hypothetical protein